MEFHHTAHIFRRNYPLRHIIELKIEVQRRQGKGSKQPLKMKREDLGIWKRKNFIALSR
jgi:hypothetical protein